MMKVRLGTRGSDLALWQAHHVAACLAGEADTEIVVITTRGDAITERPLQQVEGKAFFTAEIEAALLEKRVDLAVHSHKDLATESPPGLAVVAVPPRAPAGEVLLVRADRLRPDAAFLPLPPGARVGTSAPRRRAQLLALRPDLVVADLRGNVPTRVRRCQEGRYDAVLLAAAGLSRLALATDGLLSVPLPEALLVPAPAQGALAIQIRADDAALAALCRRCLHDGATAAAIAAERLLLERLGGGCHLPVGVHVEAWGRGFRARGFLGAGVPGAGHGARWALADGATPQAAAEALHQRLLDVRPTRCGPLAGLTVALVGAAACVAPSDDDLGHRLQQLGAQVEHEAVLGFEDLPAPQLPARLAALRAGDALAVTSQQAVRRLAGQRVPQGVVVAAVGPATARALAEIGLSATVVGDGGARALAEALVPPPGARVLFPCAEQARHELPELLQARGIEVERLPLYRTIARASGTPAAAADVRLYMSPSAVTAARELGREPQAAGAASPPAVLRVGLGAATCAALEAAGHVCERPDGSGPAAVVAWLARLAARSAAPGAPAAPGVPVVPSPPSPPSAPAARGPRA